MTKPKFRVQKFDKASHDHEAFSCGIPAMDRWFNESISDQIKANRTRVWCAVDQTGNVVGFYALSAHAVEPSSSPALATRRDRHPIPAVYLSALATDLSAQGQGLGSALMADAMAKALEISEIIGAAALVLDVLQDNAYAKRLKFYTDLGFTRIDPDVNPNRVLLSIKEISQSSAMRQKLK
ncbi:GNAT family N-acetyltransferase [Sulfitobacter sp. M57]|uniref:GNAT family N-acetyltransferase n=1 Tax=unclassified Sulfitobacter TaxID=196795 RepID=UPI0023E20456|nr:MULTISPECIES: GNAT family N-acetyltransferase [unclassified Sulfitobacter]MDF3414407.1 GNAT family N-acetyltransferase [Sulfitobacter sp. KE5]MDF3420311.1 GNAT family N-acetyltransferase [Sulfitobacter sp. KE43]MDF3432953.1 GNAT family N-acetyltransferase [Sulfitobacter sp. KE42]MDF3458593.1 GNAT family N-acetyltransferase [Sulfitobacter sp. S74]MDF3462493.1 GNAT family N-acetyltransferase [Sulfitobacter sp. Ks18]